MLTAENHVRIVHLTGNFDAGHIPGAVSAPYPLFRGPQENAGELPSASELAVIVQRLGITAETPVVLVHSGINPNDMGAATRVYWTFKSMGINDLAVLNGGFAAWQASGLPVSTDAVQITASSFQPVWSDQYRVTTEQIADLVATGEGQIIDARPNAFFTGEQTTASRAGTLPGASNLSFEDWFEGNRMRPVDAMTSMLNAATDQNAELTVTFCNTGHQGSINWFVISELGGYQNTRLYAESITEWAMDPQRPMVNER
jgi:thiosulfate/3-mercaptopyruvate sulfurtransferase